MSDEIDLPKTYLVVIALAGLGGDADLESIAIRAHELFPQVFSWKTRSDLPDKDVARAHLSEAKKKKFGHLVADVDLRKGRGIKRYALTAVGAAKARELAAVASKYGVRGSKTTIGYRRIVDPILNSQAYASFVSGDDMMDIGQDGYLEALKLFPDASSYVISARLARAEGAAHGMPQSQEKQRVIDFLREGRDVFKV